MTGRALIGGVLGGIAVFIWGAVSHMVLGLGEAGIKQIPNEQPVVALLQSALHEPGFYFFPGMDEAAMHGTGAEKEAAQRKWTEKYRQGPYGILVYHPTGVEPISPKQLGIQALTDIAAGLIAAYLLSSALLGISGVGGRITFVTLLGLFAGVSILIPYWNWYGFPSNFILAGIADRVIGWLAGGIVLALVLRPKP